MTVNQSRYVAGALAFDAQSLDQLKLQAKNDPTKAVAAAAKQFEGLFLGMVLKSMREATPREGLFDNEQTKLYTSLLDQQLAQHLAARGTGLSEMMAKQLTKGMANGAAPDVTSAADPLTPPATLALLAPNQAPWARTAPEAMEPSMEVIVTPSIAPAAPPAATTATPIPAAQTRDFVNRVWTHAVDAARSIGVKPQFMVGQAALESGWGKHEIRAADGSSSHNVFGIKAGRSWKGPVVEKTTTEYVNGVAQKTSAKFRVYGSYAEAFRDYASLLKDNPRYANVVGQAQDAKGFARGLQQAGYATDPAYADKLVRVINGATLRVALQSDAPPQMLARR
jgi:flagellar protein FlgJ